MLQVCATHINATFQFDIDGAERQAGPHHPDRACGVQQGVPAVLGAFDVSSASTIRRETLWKCSCAGDGGYIPEQPGC